MDLKELTRYVQQNAMLKEEADRIAARQKEVKEQINKGIDALAEEDGRGHLVVDIDDPVTGISKVMRQKRVSKSLDMSIAEEIIAQRGLSERCIKMIPVLNEDEIMAAFYENLLSEEDIDSMFPAKVTWALIFNK